MHKIKIVPIIMFLILVFFANPSKAHDVYNGDEIEKIDMDIEIKESGNAIVTEKWYVHSYGRYGYIKLNKNTYVIDILNVSVTDEKGTEFEFYEKYDPSIGKDNMKKKCGTLQAQEGTEIYWGVEDEGSHEFYLKYEISNFIKDFSNEGISKGINFDFVDDQVLTVVNLNIKADNYKFTEENTNLKNYNKPKSTYTFNEDGSLFLHFDPYYFEGDERIAFDNNAPFSIGKSNISDYLEKDYSLKKQDILVISLIIASAVLYLFTDTCRSIYDYKKYERKYNAIR